MSRILLLIVTTLVVCHATYMQHPVDVHLDRDSSHKLADIDGYVAEINAVTDFTGTDETTTAISNPTSSDPSTAPLQTNTSPSTTGSQPTTTLAPTTSVQGDPVEEEPVGPDDLVLVDYIIIGVTSAVLGGVIIGGIVMGCLNKKKAEEAQRTKQAKQRMIESQRLQWDNTAMQDDDIKPSKY